MMRLKYTSGRARQKEAEMVTGKSKKHTSKVSIFYSESQNNTNTLICVYRKLDSLLLYP